MSPASSGSVGFIRAIFEIAAIVSLRFAPLPRVWAAYLVGVNVLAVAFIDRPEAQVALVAAGLAIGVQALLYQRLRFVRLLGVSHIFWVPMLAWFGTRLDALPPGETAFRTWMVALILTNATSLVIDTVDFTRFVRGERLPYYTW